MRGSSGTGMERLGMRRRAFAQAAAGGVVAGMLPRLAGTAFAQGPQVPDWDVPDGHFYTQTAPEGAPADSGYLVSDADGVRLWGEYQRLGGPAQLGYPISRRYEAGGAVFQAMQAALVCWNPGSGAADVDGVFAVLAAQGLDDWLAARGIPRTSPALEGASELAVEERLSWLDHPALRAAFTGPDLASAVQRFGLPMGTSERMGPYVAQRFDKAVLQLWLDEVPGQPSPGSVSLVQVGDLLKELGMIPEDALLPQAAPAPRPAPRPAPAAQPAAASPAAPAAPAAQSAGKRVVVSTGRQWWWAYEGGSVVNNGPVTTGRPELYTPQGRFTVLSKHSPYTFVSPWPRSSPYWYETATSSFALRITGNGIFLHDAPWRPYYGPCTNVPHTDPDGVWRTGSHGCINMPYAAARWLPGWAPVGTPVDVTG